MGLFALAGPIISLVSKIVDKAVPDTDLAEKIKADLSSQIYALVETELKGAIQIILAEASGAWLQRNWRPILMLTIVAIVANNYLIAPYLDAAFGFGMQLSLPDKLWTLMTVGVGGYVGSRGIEKVAKIVKGE
jgi:hypothetical protein